MGPGPLDRGTLQLYTDFLYTVCSSRLAGLVCNSPSVQLICVLSTGSIHHRYPVPSQNNCIGSSVWLRKCLRVKLALKHKYSLCVPLPWHQEHIDCNACSVKISSIACYNTIPTQSGYPACMRQLLLFSSVKNWQMSLIVIWNNFLFCPYSLLSLF